MKDEIPFRHAGPVAGYAYNTLRKWRDDGEVPFPVYERRTPGSKKPKLFCMVSEIEEWKRRATRAVPASTLW